MCHVCINDHSILQCQYHIFLVSETVFFTDNLLFYKEYRDACKLKTWKYSLQGKNRYKCSDEVRDYLDENMPGWRDRVYGYKGHSSALQMKTARDIVQRYKERGCILPRR